MKLNFGILFAVALSSALTANADTYYPGQYVQINSGDFLSNGIVGMVTNTNYDRLLNSRKTVTVHYVGQDNLVHDDEFRAVKNPEVTLYTQAIPTYKDGDVVQVVSERYSAFGAAARISAQDSGVLRLYYVAADGQDYVRPVNSTEVVACPTCVVGTPTPRTNTPVVVPPAPQRDQCDDEELRTYNGQWIRLNNGECVFSPDVDVSWEPYRNGYWYWSASFGWTWQSYDPWGHYTDHYGVWRHYGSRWVWIRFSGSNYYWRPCGVTFFYTNSGIGWSPYYSGYQYGYNDGFNDGFWLGYQYGLHDHAYHHGMTYVTYNHFSNPGQTFYNQNYIVTKGDVARYYNEAVRGDNWGSAPGVPHTRNIVPGNLDSNTRAETYGYIQRQQGVAPIREVQTRSETRTVGSRQVQVVQPDVNTAPPANANVPRRNQPQVTPPTTREQPGTQPGPSTQPRTRTEQPNTQPSQPTQPRTTNPWNNPSPRTSPPPRTSNPTPRTSPPPRISNPAPRNNPTPRPSAPRPSNNGGGSGPRTGGPRR